MAGDHANDVLAAARGRPALHLRRLGLRPAGMEAGSAAVAKDIDQAAAIANELLPAGG